MDPMGYVHLISCFFPQTCGNTGRSRQEMKRSFSGNLTSLLHSLGIRETHGERHMVEMGVRFVWVRVFVYIILVGFGDGL